MTPALKLNEHDKKTLLSCMLKFLLLGIMRMKMSTNMIEAPNMQARQSQSCRVISDWCFLPAALRPVRIQPRVSLSILVISMVKCV